MVLVECFSQVYVSWYSECPTCPQAYQYLNNSFEPPYKTPSCCWGTTETTSPDVVKSRHTTRKRTAKLFPLEGLSLDFFERALPVVAIREMARR
ncbi:hypothetical protein ACT188_004938 [Escherichia coli]|uniref:hypothetical protein n=1 Tax=Shigella boydii TaxID=621 RepID=UPI000A699FE7|nr:hypothetical protein [Shigella boydii]EFC6289884.1 hypothetical protein [Escherichia coli]EHX4645188.1 hypothetical protein [Shigella dysenteriae]EHK6193895.1 hypothetical protein [Escherichia coli]EHX5639908.1 hypothetical protein [Shigella dysenteriae]EHX5809249.1 hypothetical protein [Shigella dysenteriae]